MRGGDGVWSVWCGVVCVCVYTLTASDESEKMCLDTHPSLQTHNISNFKIGSHNVSTSTEADDITGAQSGRGSTGLRWYSSEMPECLPLSLLGYIQRKLNYSN